MTRIPPPTGIAMPYAPLRVLDLFAGAAGGWTLGLHCAGFVTVAACEIVPWRRVLYAENNPHVRLYDDIRALTAGRVVSDLGFLPDLIAGSPPCQDISSANTRGKGIDGARSGLYLEAVRLVGECRPRWFALENSANLRTRGADRLLDALEALGYAVEACVVGAGDVGACHVRKRSWLIGHDSAQLAHTGLAITTGRDADGRGSGCAGGDEGVGSVRRLPGDDLAHADGDGRHEGRGGRGSRLDIPVPGDPRDAARFGCREGWPGRRAGADDGAGKPSRGHADTEGLGHGGGRSRSAGQDGHGASLPAGGGSGNTADADETGQPDGRVERCLRPAEITDDGRGDGWCDDGPGAAGSLGRSTGTGDPAAEPWADWNGGPAAHLRLDDGLSAWLARTRVALGDGRRASAASLVVEAFGDAVVPDIPEAIGRAILRVEMAVDAVLARGLAGGAS